MGVGFVGGKRHLLLFYFRIPWKLARIMNKFMIHSGPLNAWVIKMKSLHTWSRNTVPLASEVGTKAAEHEVRVTHSGNRKSLINMRIMANCSRFHTQASSSPSLGLPPPLQPDVGGAASRFVFDRSTSRR
jgi:hypothetical protein